MTKIFNILIVTVLLSACHKNKVEEINLNEYFANINGTAVFYNPTAQKYKIYNIPLSYKRSSPCSTFKIMSAYIGFSEEKISLQTSSRQWNKTLYWNPVWNKDIAVSEAFKSSCIWYFRRIINETGTKKTQTYLAKYNYGNQDISDWDGKLNTNENHPDLIGFWVESSLLISPIEQTQVLARIFEENNQAAQDLKEIMLVADMPIKIYGKTGMGVRDDKIADAWFVGFYEQEKQNIYFAVRLDDAENPNIADYRQKASLIAKQIAIEIINQNKLF